MGSVLCFGRDGHVAVETTTAQHQAVGGRLLNAGGLQAVPSAILDAAAMPDHGPCVDVAVIPGVDLKIGGGDTRDGHPASASSLPPITVLADTGSHLVRDVPGKFCSIPVAVSDPPALTCLSTIVLRI